MGFIEEAKYLRWVSNIMVVPKKNGNIRVCTDFTKLNNAYPMPQICDLVDTSIGHQRTSFMKAFYVYYQIPLYKSDRIHTFFVTDKGHC